MRFPRSLLLLLCGLLAVACSSSDEGQSSSEGESSTVESSQSSPPDSSVSSPSGETTTSTGTGSGTTGVIPTGTEEPVFMVRFDPLSEDYFDLPFPDDLRIDAEGRIRFTEWTELMQVQLTRLWMNAAEELVEGWGVNSGVMLHLSAPLDEATLPARMEDALWHAGEEPPSAFLIDVDPDSPEQGRTWPLDFSFREAAGARTGGNRLMAVPAFGLTRRPLTRYAFVLTDALLSADGEPLQRAPALDALLSGETTQSRLRGDVEAAEHVAAATYLESLGLPADSIRAMALFTTADPSARLRRIAAWASSLPTPEIEEPGLSLLEDEEPWDGFVVVQGRHPLPVYQEGQRPYTREGGQIRFDDAGVPEIIEEQSVRFLVAIPEGEMPEGGWPLMLYLHGSGGEWLQALNRGNPFDEDEAGYGPARIAAQYGWATASFDFPLHGDRHSPPDTSGLNLYNLTGNPRATVDNFIVSAAEMILRTRVLLDLRVDPDLAPAQLSAGEASDGQIRFNPDAVVGMGQSMGSTLGVPWATVDDNVKGLMLSGSGGLLIEIAAEAVQPFRLRPVLEQLLRYRTTGESLDRNDPVLHALQHYWDLVDPVAHARHVLLEPHEGFAPKHVYQPSGIDDGYFSVQSRTALGVALGLDALEPVREPWLSDLLTWSGAETVASASGNRGDGAVTGAIVEICPWDEGRGHYTSFEVFWAREHYGRWLASMAADGVPEIDAREEDAMDCVWASDDRP